MLKSGNEFHRRRRARLTGRSFVTIFGRHLVGTLAIRVDTVRTSNVSGKVLTVSPTRRNILPKCNKVIRRGVHSKVTAGDSFVLVGRVPQAERHSPNQSGRHHPLKRTYGNIRVLLDREAITNYNGKRCIGDERSGSNNFTYTEGQVDRDFLFCHLYVLVLHDFARFVGGSIVKNFSVGVDSVLSLRLNTRSPNSIGYIKGLLQVTSNLSRVQEFSNHTVKGRPFIDVLGVNQYSGTGLISNGSFNTNVTRLLSRIRRSQDISSKYQATTSHGHGALTLN